MSYIPRHLFSAVIGTPRTVADFIDAYLVGYGDWHGAQVEYPARAGRTTEASNMAYALYELRRTVGVEPDGEPRHVALLELDQLQPGDLRACLRRMIDGGLARKSINARKNRILRWARWAVEYGHATTALLDRLGVVKAVRPTAPGVKNKPKVDQVKPEVIAATLAVAPAVLQRAVTVQLSAKMRPGELVGMQVCHLAAGKNGCWDYRLNWHKTMKATGRSRTIPIGPMGQAALREQASTMGSEHGLFGSTVPQLGDAQDVRRIWPWKTVGGYSQAITRAAKRAATDHWSPNQLRHTGLTEVAARAGVKTAQAYGGHTTDKTTKDHYLHELEALAREDAAEHG